MKGESNVEAFACWDQSRKIIRSAKGGWRIGEAVYCHGYSMMDDLVGKTSYFQQLVLNITGKIPDRNLADWLEACFICVSWPDPRIWCNQMGALAGASRASGISGVSAGLMAADSIMYGPGVIQRCYEFIHAANQALEAGTSVEKIIQTYLQCNKDVPGYARPIAKGDERVIAMERVSADLGFQPGKHELLAKSISDYLAEKCDECINFGGYVVAFLADRGFSGKEIEWTVSTAVSSGVQACYIDAQERPEGSFLPLRVEDVHYEGQEDRDIT